MPIKRLLLPSIFIALCGCQPSTTEQAANKKVSRVSHESPASAQSSVTPTPARSTSTTNTDTREVEISAAEGLALAKKNNCLTCHSIDKKNVGPAWKEVAAKYRGDVTAEDFLTRKIAQGGRGVWGSMSMPAYPHINETDRRNLARFVLNLK
ncbi:MAG: c-type cytochrome [Gallionella sp.]